MSNSTFAANALPLAALNLRVIPVEPREKACRLPDWQNLATRDAAVISEWDTIYPNHNLGVVAKLEEGELCVLEFDVKGGMRAAAEERGEPLPETRTVRSGKGFGHYYFWHTPKSVALGNRQANKDGHEWFSFRADNRYVVAPGSIHPNGNEYKFNNDAPIIPIPDWLVDWIAKQSETASKPKGAVEVHEDFDFECWLDHYGFEIAFTKDDYWHVVEACPGVGRRHEHSTLTAIYYDGSSLGWSDFAQGCPLGGKSIGGLLKWMHENGFEPYKGVIWSDQESVDELLEAFDAEQDSDNDDQKSMSGAGQESASGDAAAAEEPSKVQAPAPQLIHGSLGETISSEASKPPAKVDPGYLDFPEDCLYGKLGEWARQMKMPLGLAYPALIGCYSMKPKLDRMCGTRINTYIALIAKPEGGKNQAIERAIVMTDIYPNLDYMKASPGGDAQLAALLGDKACRNKSNNKDRIPGPRKMGLVNGEMTDMLKKTSIDNSVLASKMCNLWDDNEDVKPTKDGFITINCRVSWLGGIPADIERPERFAELFGSESNYGLYPRFIFGYSGVAFNYRHWESPVRSEEVLLTEEDEVQEFARQSNGGVTVVRSIHPDAQAFYDKWNPAVHSVGRLRQNLMKVASLSASANGDEELNADCMAKAILFMEWQLKVREVFKPSEAEAGNKEAMFTNMLLPALEQKGATKEFVSWRRISLDRKWDRKIDAGLQYRTVENLIKLGRLIQEEVTDENDASGKKKKKTMKVKIRQ
jgi:hypothetical protein